MWLSPGEPTLARPAKERIGLAACHDRFVAADVESGGMAPVRIGVGIARDRVGEGPGLAQPAFTGDHATDGEATGRGLWAGWHRRAEAGFRPGDGRGGDAVLGLLGGLAF